MTLPATVDAVEDLPEAVRSHYVKTEDGRFRLDAEGVEDTAGLKSALEKERAERKALKAELAVLKRPQEDPDPEAEAEPQQEEVDTGEQPGEPGSAMPPVEVDPMRLALEARLIEAEARAAIQSARGVSELLLPILRDRLAVVADEESGSPMVRILDETGAPLRRDDGGDASFLTVADFVERLRADPLYARAFDGSGKGGSGAPTAGRGEGGPVTVSASDPRAIARHVADIAAGRVRLA
ncbi:MAG: hypothetical protein HQ481_20390 [Alphaproteobacteria bacterium]|nr:hypothetical protein [Alphaproteobacteria bacterium]